MLPWTEVAMIALKESESPLTGGARKLVVSMIVLTELKLVLLVRTRCNSEDE